VAAGILEHGIEVFLHSFTKSLKICSFQFIQVTDLLEAEEEVALFSVSLL
jgi:hypothetical protein